MDLKTFGENIVAKAIKWGASEAEAYLESEKKFNVNVLKGDVELLEKSVSRGLGLRIFINKQLGFSYTSDLSEKSLDDTIKKTIELAHITEPKPWQGLPDFGQQILSNLDLYDPEIARIPDEKKIVIAHDVEHIALSQDKRITNSNGGSFSNSEKETAICNSRGISYSFKESGCSFGVSVVAGKDDDMHIAGWSSSKRFFKELASLEDVASHAVKDAIAMLGPKPVKTKTVPVIIDRYAASPFWQGILDSLNGDDAFRKVTFMSELLNKQIASPLITLYDDPTIPRHTMSFPFDGEGCIAKKNVIIEKGVLQMFLYDSQIARKAGVKTNTIAIREDYKSLPSPGYLNIIIENGKDNFSDLIKEIKDGFYVKRLRGIGTNSTTGSFSVGASGFWISNGAIAFPVDGLTLGGNALDILKNIDRLANDLDLRSTINSPSFRTSSLMVGGK